MCLNSIPINISGRLSRVRPGFASAGVVNTPCGVCDECISQFQNDYFIRCFSEYQECISKGGKVAFLTFTYDNYNVPLVRYNLNESGDDIDFEFVNYFSSCEDDLFCFEKKHWQRFCNSFRKFLSRKNSNAYFRYFLVPEYGSDNKYTQRPHYHVLLYLNSDLVGLYSSSGSFDSSSFLSDVNSFWHYGLISASKKGLFIESCSAIKYTCKYISKSILTNSLRRFSSFYKFLSLHSDSLSPAGYNGNYSLDSLYKFYLRKFGSNLFTLKSKNFGLSAISDLLVLKDKSYFLLYEKFEDGFRYVDNDGKRHSIPFSFYYYRKLFYDFNPDDSSFTLNICGFNYLIHSFYSNFCKFRDNVLHLDSSSLKSSPFSDDFVFFDNMRNNFDFLYSLYIYSRFLRGNYLPKFHSTKILKFFDNIDFHSLSGDSFDRLSSFLQYSIKLRYGYVFFDDVSFEFSNHNNVDSFSDFMNTYPLCYDSNVFFYFPFERFLNVYNYLKNSISSVKLAEKSRKCINSKLLRDLDNLSLYNS